METISLGTELEAHWFIAWNIENCRKWGGKIKTQEQDTKTIKENFSQKQIPSPYDAIVRGEQMSFREIEVISFEVTSSTAFKKSSTGFLSREKTSFSYRQYSISSIKQMQATIGNI